MAMTVRTMRQRLEAYVDLRREIEMQALRLDQMRDSRGDIRSPSYNPGGTSSLPGDGVARDVMAITQLEERVAQLVEAEKAEHSALDKIIANINNARQRALLRMRYFDLREWAYIAFSFYGDQTDYLTDEHGYITKCYRLHYRAVDSMVAVQKKLRV